MAQFGSNLSRIDRADDVDQPLPPPLSEQLAGMDLHPFLAKELDDFENIDTSVKENASMMMSKTAMMSTLNMPPPGFGSIYNTPTPKSKPARTAVDPTAKARKERAKICKRLEKKDPFRLSHILRAILFVYGEQFVFAPHSETGRLLPHMRGPEAESIITAIFRKYAEDDGHIHPPGFTMFMEDTNLMLTHVARDAKTGEIVDKEKEAKLSPEVVFSEFSELPRGVPEPKTQASRKKVYPLRTMDFPQFYRALLMVSKAALPAEYEDKPSETFNEIITTNLISVYSWGPNRWSKMSSDESVKDPRIALLIRAYMPNLWRVFLFYATDIEGNTAQGAYSFPATAQSIEKVLSSFHDINQSTGGALSTFLRWENEERMNHGPNGEPPDMNALTFVDCHDGAGFCIFLEVLARFAMIGLSTTKFAMLYRSAYERILAVLSVWGVADPAKLDQVLQLNGSRDFTFTTDAAKSISDFQITDHKSSSMQPNPDNEAPPIELMITEGSWARFIEDYSLTPAIMSKKKAVSIFRRTLLPDEDLGSVKVNTDVAAARDRLVNSDGTATASATPDSVTLHSRSIRLANEAEQKRSQLRLTTRSMDKMLVQADVSSSDIIDLVSILNEQRTNFSSLVSTVEEELSLAHPDLDQEGIDEIIIDSLNEHVHEEFDRNDEQKSILYSNGIDVRHPHVVHTVLREPGDLPRKGDPQASDQVLMLRIPGRIIAARLFIKGLDTTLIDRSTIQALEYALAKTVKGMTATSVKILEPIERVELDPLTSKPVEMKTSLVAFHIHIPIGQSMFKIASSMRTTEYCSHLMKYIRAAGLRSVQKVVNVRLLGDRTPKVQTLGLTQLALTTSWEVPDDEFAEVYSSIAIYDKMFQLQGFIHRSRKGSGPIKYYQTHEHEDHQNDVLSVHEMFSLDIDALPDTAYYLFHIISSERGLQEVLSPSVELFDMFSKNNGALARINLYNTHLYEGHTPGTEGAPQSIITCMLARVTDKTSAFRDGWKLEFLALRTQGTSMQHTLGIKRCIAEALRYRTRADSLKEKNAAANSLMDAHKESHLMRGSAKMFATAASEWNAHENEYKTGTLTLQHFLDNVESILQKHHPTVTAHMNKAKATRSQAEGSLSVNGNGYGVRRSGDVSGSASSVVDGSVSSSSSVADGLMGDALCKWFNNQLDKARKAASEIAMRKQMKLRAAGL